MAAMLMTKEVKTLVRLNRCCIVKHVSLASPTDDFGDSLSMDYLADFVDGLVHAGVLELEGVQQDFDTHRQFAVQNLPTEKQSTSPCSDWSVTS